MVAGRGFEVLVAGVMSRSRVQCRGRAFKVAVTGPTSLLGKLICMKFKFEFEVAV